MFEQAVLPAGPSGRRIWMTSAGLVGESLAVTAAILGALMWPEALPKVQAMLVAPPAPIGEPIKTVAVRPKSQTAAPRPVFDPSKLVIPTRIIAHAQTFVDAPPLADSALIGGGGTGVGLPSGLIDAILTPPTTAPPPAVEKPKVAAKPPEPAPPARVRVGGVVLPPQLLRQVQPIYPSIAKTARLGGTVELDGVIGADGRVRELRVVSGSPLLTRAALDAVSQWLYAPTRLNGQIVEVITKITVKFQLQ